MSDYFASTVKAVTMTDDDLPLFRQAARGAGRAAGEACLAKAEKTTTFDAAAARAAVLELLADGVARSGEQIVDHCESLGLVPHDGRAFGPVFAALSRAKQIEVIGIVSRRKGNGTAGARMWRLKR
jgi:hypothetical protein